MLSVRSQKNKHHLNLIALNDINKCMYIFLGELCFGGRWTPKLTKGPCKSIEIKLKDNISVFPKMPFVDFEKKKKYF